MHNKVLLFTDPDSAFVHSWGVVCFGCVSRVFALSNEAHSFIALRWLPMPADPRDGHRECPTCLGEAHVKEDVENPCMAALYLPLEERAQRAKVLEQYEAQ